MRHGQDKADRPQPRNCGGAIQITPGNTFLLTVQINLAEPNNLFMPPQAADDMYYPDMICTIRISFGIAV